MTPSLQGNAATHISDVFVPWCDTMTSSKVGSYPTNQYWVESPSPPVAVGWKPGFASQFATQDCVITNFRWNINARLPPQLHDEIVLGRQYAVLA